LRTSKGSVELGHQAQPRPIAEAEAKQEEQLDAFKDEQVGGGGMMVTLQAGPSNSPGVQIQVPLAQTPFPEQKIPSLKQGGGGGGGFKEQT
jgi:hypothetical protein